MYKLISHQTTNNYNIINYLSKCFFLIFDVLKHMKRMKKQVFILLEILVEFNNNQINQIYKC